MMRTAFASIMLASGLIACGTEAPEYSGGKGQEAIEEVDQASYPEGPYGAKRGEIMPNVEFYGFPSADGDKNTLVKMSMADLYNPTGDAVYEEGSAFGAGTAKPKALIIDISAVWCVPCQQYSRSVLPDEYERLRPLGGEFLLQLADNGGTTQASAGPADLKDLQNWTTKYKTPCPAAIDPLYKLFDDFKINAFPTSIMVDLRTMEIVDNFAGVPDAAFFAKFEDVINGN